MDVELINQRVVAVDGGTATGKGRLIEELAQLMRLKGVPVIHASTGSIYRAVAVAALDACKHDLVRVRKLSPNRLLELASKRQIAMHGGQVWMDGAPVSVDEVLKGAGVGMAASVVSSVIEVRHLISDITRRQINEFDGFALIDGRDIGHKVVPDAPLKLLLTVAPAVAATRSREHSMEEIIARDARDRAKTYGELRHPDDPGEGVIVLPTDNHTPESVRDHVYQLMRQTFAGLPAID
ncbi:MAG: (d)CMP kinase [Candidatus Saccharimonadales bacterium]